MDPIEIPTDPIEIPTDPIKIPTDPIKYPMITPSKVLSCFLRSMFRRQRLKQKDKTLLKPAIAMTMVEGGKMKQITRLSKNMRQRNPMPCLAGTAPALTPVIR